MALLDDVKSELAAFEGDSPAAIKAQAAAMIRFGGGLRPVQNAYVIQAGIYLIGCSRVASKHPEERIRS